MTTTELPSFADVEKRLIAAAGQPRLVWYGDDGERIELSGAVLINWAAKTANMLVDECDVEPGQRVLLDLPAHWRSLAIALGAWQADTVVAIGNAEASEGNDGGTNDDPDVADVAFHADSDGLGSEGVSILVSLGALDLSYPGEVPPGVVDYAAVVRSFGDGFVEPSPTTPMQLEPSISGVEEPPATDDRTAVALSAERGLARVLPLTITLWMNDQTLVLAREAKLLTPSVIDGERATVID